MLKDNFNFLKAGLLKIRTGAISRSSPYVIRDVIELIKDKKLDRVIEYGPGDGVMTRELLKLLPPDGKLLAVEINPNFLEILRRITDLRLQVVDGKIQDVSRNIKKYGFENADLVVSSIPFSFLSKTERQKVLTATSETLTEGGMFIIFHQYTNMMAKALEKIFGKAQTRFELRNLPPCFIISATKHF